MRSCHRNRSNGENVTRRIRNVDQAKAARAKAAIKAAKSQSPKSVFKNRKFRAAVDLETPKSLLVNIRLKSVINLDTYDLLSYEEKERLFLVLPSCDQQKDQNGMPILNSEALNNEFFAKACVEWCERLGEGEFLKDRQQGDASCKVKEFGTLNGAKSHAIKSLSSATKINRNNRDSILTESPLLHVTRLRNGVSVKPMSSGDNTTPIQKRCRQHARNLRLQQLSLDDRASLVSDTSSESSFSLHQEQSRVGSSNLGYAGDGDPSATLGNGTVGRVARRGPLVNSHFFIHPALRDHDYADFTSGWKSITSRVSAASGRYRRRRRRRKKRRVRSEKSFGVRGGKGLVSEVQGRCCFTGVGSGADLRGDVLHLNGAAVDSKGGVANTHVLSLDDTLFSNPLVNGNGRLNGSCLSGKKEHCLSVQHLANVAPHDSCLKENDVNLNHATRPHRRKSLQHLRKLEQTDGTPLIQIQGSELLSRLSCARIDQGPDERDLCNKGCSLLPCSTCISKTELKPSNDFAISGSDIARTASDVDRLLSGLSNSASVQKLDNVRTTEFGLSDHRTKPGRKFFVKFIGIQKIPLDRETTGSISNSQVDSSLDSNTTSLPPSVLEEVRDYIRVGGDLPCVGRHTSTGPSDGQLPQGRSLELSFPSNGTRSQADSVTHTLSIPTDFRENGRNMQNFRLITDLRRHGAKSGALDSTECVWEAVKSDVGSVDRGH